MWEEVKSIQLSCNSLEAYVLLPDKAVPSPLVDRLEFVSQVHYLLAHPHCMLEDSAVPQGIRSEGGGVWDGLGSNGSAGRETVFFEFQPAGQGMGILPAHPWTQYLFLFGVFRLVGAQGVGAVEQYMDCLLFSKPLGLLPAVHLIKYKRRPIIIIAKKQPFLPSPHFFLPSSNIYLPNFCIFIHYKLSDIRRAVCWLISMWILMILGNDLLLLEYGCDSSTIIMNRKRKTQKYQNLRLPLSTQRPSLKYSAILPLQHADHEKAMRLVVEELVSGAERAIFLRQNSADRMKQWLEVVETEQQRYLQLSHSPQIPTILCEEQPKTAHQHIPPFSHQIARKDKSNTAKSPEIKRDDVQAKIQAQQSRTRQSHIRKWEEVKRCRRNELISLRQQPRTSEAEDRSEEIQQLLRRKKQLLHQSKSAVRAQTEASRTLSTDQRDKEKRHFWQNDEGEACEAIHKPIKTTKQMAPLLNLTHIRVLPGQQSITLLKKKPIVDLVTARRRKRKGVGDTCVLVQQLHEIQTSGQDLTEIMEKTYRPQNNTRLVSKQRTMTTILRLPTIR